MRLHLIEGSMAPLKLLSQSILLKVSATVTVKISKIVHSLLLLFPLQINSRKRSY